MRHILRFAAVTIAILVLALGAVRAQSTTGQKPPDTKPAVAADTQAKPAEAPAAQEDLPPDFKAFNDAGKEKDPQKRVEAYEKFIADHPKSPLAATARTQIQTTLLTTLKTAQSKYLELMQQQIETAKQSGSPSALASTYSRLASSLLASGVLLDQAEEYARQALASLDEARFIQERKQAAERAAEAFARRAAAPAAAAPATPPAAPSGGFTITMVDGVPFARPAPPRPAAAAPATPPQAPRVPTDDELRASFRMEKASQQATLGQVLLRRGKTDEGTALLKEVFAAGPPAATMVGVARALAESAKKAGDERGQLEYLAALALTGRITAAEQRDLEAVYRHTHNGSLDGLEDMLDARYRRTAPRFEVKPSPRTVRPTDRAVLVEMFTGAG